MHEHARNYVNHQTAAEPDDNRPEPTVADGKGCQHDDGEANNPAKSKLDASSVKQTKTKLNQPTEAIHANIRGLNPKSNQTKLPYIKDQTKLTQIPYMMFQETHLNEHVCEAEVSIENYSMYRSDRKMGRQGGGVCTYVRSDLAVKQVFIHSNGFCESLATDIPELDLAIINIYRPPGCATQMFKETVEEIKCFIEKIENESNKTPTIICGGDFNVGMLGAWKRNNIEAFKASVQNKDKIDKNKGQAVLLVAFAEEYFMKQAVKQGTKFDNILDIILCNDHNLIISCEVNVNKQLSDHNTIKPMFSFHLKELESKEKVKHATTTIPTYDVESGDDEDWMRMISLLDAANLEEKMNDEVSVTKMTNILLQSIETKVKKTFKPKENFKKETETEKQVPKPPENESQNNTEDTKEETETNDLETPKFSSKNKFQRM